MIFFFHPWKTEKHPKLSGHTKTGGGLGLTLNLHLPPSQGALRLALPDSRGQLEDSEVMGTVGDRMEGESPR